MICALYAEQPNGWLKEISAAGYKRTEVKDGKAVFPPAGEPWPAITHVAFAEKGEDLPSVIPVVSPCALHVVDRDCTVTINLPEPDPPLYSYLTQQEADDYLRSGEELGLYQDDDQWPNVVGD